METRLLTDSGLSARALGYLESNPPTEWSVAYSFFSRHFTIRGVTCGRG
jgi:hypothetical protein